MEFYEVVEKRRTIRDFESEDIPKEVVERVISAAMKAPTNDHMRDWHFIIVKNHETAARLLDIVPKGISDEDMNRLIKDWNLNDSLQQECYRNAVWILMDYSDVIIHVFDKDNRLFYNLERIWTDGLSVDPETLEAEKPKE